MSFLSPKCKEEGGFSLTEVLVGGVILVVGLLSMVSMFDTSFRGIGYANLSLKASRCLRGVVEEMKGIPFYIPHNSSNANLRLDFDDMFWGDRSPIWSNPKISQDNPSPDWDNIPSVSFFSYGERGEYREFRAEVQMAYVDEFLNVVDMNPSFHPTLPSFDKPLDVNNRSVDVILFRVRVFWVKGGEEVELNAEDVITNFLRTYELGISKVEVISPDQVKVENKPNASYHYPGVPVYVKIEGWGFNASVGPNRASFSLVRSGFRDIPITLTSLTSTQAVGHLRLDRSTESDNPSNPYAVVGFWTVKVKQEVVVSSYLFNGFQVFYPKPLISDFGVNGIYSLKSVGKTQVFIHVRGKNFLWLSDNDPSLQVNAMFVLFGEGDTIIRQVSPSSKEKITISNKGYTTSDCEVKFTFDFPSNIPSGDYFLKLSNFSFGGEVGHSSSSLFTVPLVVRDYTIKPFAIDYFSPLSDGFWVNYYDIPCVIQGGGLTNLTSLRIYREGTSYTLAKGVEWNIVSDEIVTVSLNLIGCSEGQWTLEGTNNMGEKRVYPFTVGQGTPTILPPRDNPSSLYIDYWRWNRWGDSYETTTQRAYAYCSTSVPVVALGYITDFLIRGKGYPISSTYRMKVRFFGDGLNEVRDVSISYNRSTKEVRARLKGDSITMPYNRSGLYGIEVYIEGTNWKSTYNQRWELRQ